MTGQLDCISESQRAVTTRYAAKGMLRRGMIRLNSGGGCDQAWLGPRERSALAALHDASRRDDWLLGRWMMKQLVVETLFANGFDALDDLTISQRIARLQRIEVLPQTIGGLPSRPLLVLDGIVFAGQVSLSHSDGGVLVAITSRPGIGVGVDLVTSAKPSEGFLRLWFTDRERNSLSIRPDLAMLVWGAKEASYKALHRGERFAPTSFEVTALDDDPWQCLYRPNELAARIETRQVASGTWAVLADSQHDEQHNPSSLSDSLLCGIL